MTDDPTQRLYALGSDTRTADSVAADMGRMLEHHGSSTAALRADPVEWLTAVTRCAACGEVERCHRFLERGGDDPAEFCGNADEFAARQGFR